ncbi:MAG: hypothetical protein K5905_21675, partial [Roseibium sp.]|uniref:hypothetical protein n=1 Tax=Roseibium sp. TaxID=1936156 RepID=UPI0026319276
LPLPKRFNAAMTEKAYANLRALNEDWHYGNNYLLTIILENFDEIVDQDRFHEVMREFVSVYGQPDGQKMGADRT